MSKYQKTDEAGIKRHAEIAGKFRIRATATAPNGERAEAQATLENSTMLDAIKMREELKADIRQPKAQPTKRSMLDFVGDWGVAQVKAGKWSEGTAQINRQNLRHHILPVLGNLDVRHVDRPAIKRWVAHVEGKKREKGGELVPYANGSLRRWWKLLKQIVKALYLEGYCERVFYDWCCDECGPTSDVAPRRERETLTLEELLDYVEQAKNTAPTRYGEIVTLVFTGMRAGELYGLERQHVDFEAGQIRIEQSHARTKEGGALKCTKTGESRDVPMISLVAQAIQTQYQRMIRKQNVGFLEDGIVFPSVNEKRRFASSLRKPMLKVAEACDLDVKVGPQVLRRTFNTILGNAGFRREMIKSFMGHATDTMHEHYTNIRSEDKRAVTRLFEGIGA